MTQQHNRLRDSVKVKAKNTVTGFIYRYLRHNKTHEENVLALADSHIVHVKSLNMFILRQYSYSRWVVILSPELYEFKLSEHKPR